MSSYWCLRVDMLLKTWYWEAENLSWRLSKKPNYEQITLISINSEFDLQQKKEASLAKLPPCETGTKICARQILSKTNTVTGTNWFAFATAHEILQEVWWHVSPEEDRYQTTLVFYAEASLLARRPLPSTCVELGGTSDSITNISA
jgi:hypothetical protein